MARRSKTIKIIVDVSPPNLVSVPVQFDQEDVALQPWYLPKPVSLEIRRILPAIHLSKMRYYFDDYGCLRCQKRDALYGSNGFCEACCHTVRDRLKRCLKKRLRSVGVVSAESSDEALNCAREIIAHQRGQASTIDNGTHNPAKRT